jgi:methionyl-tRNA formyltransferase
MRFAFAGIDFLGDVFKTLLDRGWTPLKLFSRPCDDVYDFNAMTTSWARSARIPVQHTRIGPADLASLNRMGCEALVVAGYPWLVKGWERFIPYGVNFHPSPLPEGRGPYPLFQAILDGHGSWGMTAHALAPSFDTGPIVAQRRFALTPADTHDTLLAKCQMAAKAIAADLADNLPDLWREAEPQGAGSYWPRVTQAQRTVTWKASVADTLRTIRAFGSIEVFAQVASTWLYVWEAAGWEESHGFAPGTLVHRHQRHLVVAARDGFVQLTGWSSQPPEKRKGPPA